MSLGFLQAVKATWVCQAGLATGAQPESFGLLQATAATRLLQGLSGMPGHWRRGRTGLPQARRCAGSLVTCSCFLSCLCNGSAAQHAPTFGTSPWQRLGCRDQRQIQLAWLAAALDIPHAAVCMSHCVGSPQDCLRMLSFICCSVYGATQWQAPDLRPDACQPAAWTMQQTLLSLMLQQSWGGCRLNTAILQRTNPAPHLGWSSGRFPSLAAPSGAVRPVQSFAAPEPRVASRERNLPAGAPATASGSSKWLQPWL